MQFKQRPAGKQGRFRMQKRTRKKNELRAISWAVVSLVCAALAGCQVAPPKGEACVAFVQDGVCANFCWDMERDFDTDGNVRSDARARRKPCGVSYFDRRVNFDPQSFANLKAFALKVKAQCEAR